MKNKKLHIAIAMAIVIALVSTLLIVNLYAAPVTVGNFVVDYVIQSDWGSGATISVTLKNNGSAVQGWTVGWTFPGNQIITNMWNASYTQSGATVTVKNVDFNGSIATGGTVNFGFNVNYSGSNTAPTSFTVNSSGSNTPTPTSRQSSTPTQRVTATPTPTRVSSTPTPTRRVTPTSTQRLTPTVTRRGTVTATPTPTRVNTPTPTSGRSRNSGLPVPPGSSNVPKPSGTAGGLTVVNWAGFTGGAASFTFDDANQSQIDHYSELNALGVHMTFYLISSKAESSNSIWAQALKDGHELGNHTQTHASVATASEIDSCTTFIQQQFGVTPLTMAAPYGDMSYPPLAQSRFLFNRGVWGGSIGVNDSTDPYNLLCNGPDAGAPASAMISTFSAARNLGNWQIYLVHGFTGGTDGAYNAVAISDFISCVNTVKGWGDMWTDTVLNVGAYWRAQKLLSSVTPTTSGSDLIYSWTLPAHFPSNRYLRVKVTGGTLKQNGQVLNWDGHGYYEISLDAGSLTISP